MKKIIIAFVISIIVTIGMWSAYTLISFEDYKENLEKTAQQNLDKYKIKREFKTIRDKRCGKVEQWDYYVISPICLRKQEYPKLWFREAVDYIRPYVESFQDEYDLYKQDFTFHGTKPIINYDKISLSNYYQNTPAQQQIITKLEQKNIKIKIHKKYFAKYYINNFSFYPVKKDLLGIWDCALTNYKVWIETMRNFYLKPNQVLNFNKQISYIPWYCHGSTQQWRPFYGWVCWSAGQLFRTSLIIPNITITKRYPHSKRRSQYYGKIIYGDDAAVLDTRKQLEIRNDGYLPIYYKILDKWDYNYLVGILPNQSRESVHITKKQTWPLTAEVTKKTYNQQTQTIKNLQTFISQYYTISNAWV